MKNSSTIFYGVSKYKLYTFDSSRKVDTTTYCYTNINYKN